MNNPQQRLLNDVKKFLEVYKVLSPDGKAQFEGQMAGSIKDQDDKTRKLYHALLQAAKDGKDVEAAIQEMGKG
ncbi:MAG: hypothetical protein U9R38_06020 [Candidatus Margulisiibacteriota bacterium]|nr:hypothetical protein [Candidatus Margulisiibacteriota bacterium]